MTTQQQLLKNLYGKQILYLTQKLGPLLYFQETNTVDLVLHMFARLPNDKYFAKKLTGSQLGSDLPLDKYDVQLLCATLVNLASKLNECRK